MLNICFISAHVSEGKSFLLNQIHGSIISPSSVGSETYDICIFGPTGNIQSPEELQKQNKIDKINKKNLSEKFIKINSDIIYTDYPAFDSYEDNRNIYNHFLQNQKKYDIILFIFDISRGAFTKKAAEILKQIPEAFLICTKYNSIYESIFEEISFGKKYTSQQFIQWFSKNKEFLSEAKKCKNENSILEEFNLRPINCLSKLTGKESIDFWVKFSKLIMNKKENKLLIEYIGNRFNLASLPFIENKEFIFELSLKLDFGENFKPYLYFIKQTNYNWNVQELYRTLRDILNKQCKAILSLSILEQNLYEKVIKIFDVMFLENNKEKILWDLI